MNYLAFSGPPLDQLIQTTNCLYYHIIDSLPWLLTCYPSTPLTWKITSVIQGLGMSKWQKEYACKWTRFSSRHIYSIAFKNQSGFALKVNCTLWILIWRLLVESEFWSCTQDKLHTLNFNIATFGGVWILVKSQTDRKWCMRACHAYARVCFKGIMLHLLSTTFV